MFNISVVVPAFQASETIEVTINSILTQTYLPIEVLVVLDGPDKKFIQIFKSRNFPSYVRLEQLPQNVGVATARNEGIKRSRGEYIALCDADDIWHPQKLEIQTLYIKKGYMLIATQALRFSDFRELEFQQIEQNIFKKYREVDSQDLLVYNPFYTSSLLFKRELFNEVKFNTKCKQEDYQFLIDLFYKFKFLASIDKRHLIGYRISNDSRSGNLLYSAINNFMIKKKNFGLITAISMLPLYFFNVMRKRYLS